MMRQVNSTFTGRNKEPHFLMRPMEHPSSAESPWHITNFIFTIVECKVHLSISSTFHGSWFSTTKEFIYITNTFHHHFALLTNNSLVSFSAFLCYVILSDHFEHHFLHYSSYPHWSLFFSLFLDNVLSCTLNRIVHFIHTHNC